MKFSQYDTVTVKRILVPIASQHNQFDLRPPMVGDVACIVEVYTDPAGYELECSDANGITQWLIAFAPDEVELALTI
jgi:hypothetical protein